MRAAAPNFRFSAILPLVCVAFCVLFSTPVSAQQQLGTVVGEVRVQRGDFPPQKVLVLLTIRGAVMESTYTDGQGKFGFYALPPNLYSVEINDDNYQPVHESAELSPVGLTAFVRVTLVPKPGAKEAQPKEQFSGGNPNVSDVREYRKHFPKKAVKEFDKGTASDSSGKRQDAIRHYEKAIQLAPDFYPAHNNLGSDQLASNNLPAARAEFETVVRLNQTDATGYFNLANVCMLMNQLADAQHFLDEGLRRQPESSLGKFLLGSLDLRTGKLGWAEQALRESVQLNPLMAQSRLQLINVLLKEGKKAEALSQLHEFVTAFPSSPFRPQAEQLLRRLQAAAATPSGPS
ncbi:MAG TPA: tetratricopeptide repeat protein [Terriglobales bacterium]|nr:tetratricopeptide repeat protein [Terriglobales bacterium]